MSVNYLDLEKKIKQHVIGQDYAIQLALAFISLHFDGLRTVKKGMGFKKPNMLFFGPTGTGKTLLAKALAKFLKVPFIKTSATQITEVGYIGKNPEEMIWDLAIEASKGSAYYDIEKTERGIIFVDELDKIAVPSSNGWHQDVSRQPVQHGFLELIEGTTVLIAPKGVKVADCPKNSFLQVRTENILFIFAGAFTDLEKKIEKRINEGITGGFITKIGSPIFELLKEADPRDFRNFGLCGELMGRIPALIPFKELTQEDLLKVLQKIDGNLVKHYTDIFSQKGVKLDFTVEALKIIVKNALDYETGARSLLATMLKAIAGVIIAYEHSQDKKNIKECLINKDVLLGKSAPIFKYGYSE